MRIVLISLLASAGALRLAIPHTKKTSDATSLGEVQQEGSKDFEELKSALKQMEPSSQCNPSRHVRLDPSDEQGSFRQFQEELLGGEMNRVLPDLHAESKDLYNFDWGKDAACMKMPSGSQRAPTSFTAAAPELFEKGMVMCGDSTMRNLFGFMCAFETGITTEQELSQFAHELYESKGGNDIIKCSEGDLTFVGAYHMDQWEVCHNFMQSSKARYKYVGLPGMHTLWSPGDRERTGTICTKALENEFHQDMRSMIGNFSALGAVLGNVVSMCDSKLGEEGEIVKLYWMQRQAASQRLPIMSFVNEGRNYSVEKAISNIGKELVSRIPSKISETDEYMKAMKSSGRILPLPWLHCVASSDDDHGRDDYLFWDKGAQHVNSIVTKLLTEHSETLFANMYDTSNARCDHTGDGRHYDARVLEVQASLLSTLWLLHEEHLGTTRPATER